MKSKTGKPLPAYSASAEFEQLHVRPRLDGRTLIAGSKLYGERQDRRTLYAEAIGVDALAGPGVDKVVNLEMPGAHILGTFVHIDCLSVLEHSARPWLLAANLVMMLEKGGTLFVSAPFVWRVHGYPNDYFRYTTEAIRSLFPGIEWSALMYGNTKLVDDMSAMGHRLGDGHRYFPRTEVFGFGVRK